MPIMAVMSGPHSRADALRNDVQWETKLADGGLVHIAGFDDKGRLHVTNIWETEAHLQKFSRDRLGPAIAKLKLPVPEMSVYPIHATFGLPGYAKYLKKKSAHAA